MRMMNKKERVRAAINFKNVDKIPTIYRGIKFVSESLMEYYHFQDYKDLSKNYKNLLKKLGADFWSSGHNIGQFSNFLPDYHGEKPEPPQIEDWSLFYTIGIGSTPIRIDKYDFVYYGYDNKPPLVYAQSPNDIGKDFLNSKLDLYDFDSYKNWINFRMVENTSAAKNRKGKVEAEDKDNNKLSYENLKKNGEDFICFGSLNQFFIICCYLRGMEQFLIDLASNKKLAEYIIKMVGEFVLEFNRRELDAFGDKAEWYSMWDDTCGQSGLMISPELFKKYYYPLYRKLSENVKKHDLIFSWHCCGNTTQILPYIMDCEIDVYDVVQTSAKNMDLENIYKLCNKKLCLHGGLDVQKLIVYGKPDDIKKEIKKVIDLWDSRGGIILGPSHEIVPGTPIENIIALYEQLKKYL